MIAPFAYYYDFYYSAMTYYTLKLGDNIYVSYSLFFVEVHAFRRYNFGSIANFSIMVFNRFQRFSKGFRDEKVAE